MPEVGGYNIPTWLCITVPSVILAYKYIMSKYNVFKKKGIPGPSPIPFVGTTAGMMSMGIPDYDVDMKRKYGKLVGTYNGFTPCLLVSDLDMLKDILIKDFSHFMNHQMTDAVNKSCQTLVSRMRRTAGVDVELKEECGYFAMDVIASVAFGIDVDSGNNPNNMFVKNGRAVIEAFNTAGFVGLKVAITVLLPGLAKMLGMSIYPPGVVDFFRNMVDQAIKFRQEENSNSKDFLQIVNDVNRGDPPSSSKDIQANPDLIRSPEDMVYFKSGLTRDEIVASSFIFFIGGFDTSATALSFLIYELACNPEAQEKLYQEVQDVMENKDEPDYDMMKNMPYLSMCLDETMRLYPPVYRTDRECCSPVEINGVQFDEGMIVHVPLYQIHRDPDIWPEPDKFIPERFTAEEKAKRHPMAYLPFGGGPRICIGMRLALMEIKFCMIHLLKSFKIVTCDKTEIPIKLKKVSTESENGAYVKFEER